jgi:hypothetical protein
LHKWTDAIKKEARVSDVIHTPTSPKKSTLVPPLFPLPRPNLREKKHGESTSEVFSYLHLTVFKTLATIGEGLASRGRLDFGDGMLKSHNVIQGFLLHFFRHFGLELGDN